MRPVLAATCLSLGALIALLASVRSASADSDDTSAPPTVQIQVLDGRGRPLARVGLFTGTAAGEALLVEPAPTSALAESDAEGQLQVPPSAAAAREAGLLYLAARNHAPVRVPRQGEQLLVRLLPSRGLLGRIGLGARPPEGVRLRARGFGAAGELLFETRLSETSTFAFPTLHGGTWSLHLQRLDGRWQSLGLARAGSIHDAEVPTGGEVWGRLVKRRAEDPPIVDLELLLVPESGDREAARTRVDPAGDFLFAGLTAGLYRPELAGISHVFAEPPAHVVVGDPRELVRVLWEVRPSAVMTGRIVDPAKRGVVGVRVVPLRYKDASGLGEVLAARSATTDATGRFRLEGLEEALPHRLLIEAPERAGELTELLAWRLAGVLDIGEYVLESPTTLTIRTTDEEGRPLEGVEVELAALDRGEAFGPDALPSLRKLLKTDGTGDARFEGVPKSALLIVARRFDRMPLTHIVEAEVTRQSNAIVLAMPAARALLGTVTQTRGGPAIAPPFRIEARPRDGSGEVHVATTDANGGFRFAALRSVRHDLFVFGRTDAPSLPLGMLLAVVPGAEETVSIPLASHHEVSGSVMGLEAAGSPAEVALQVMPSHESGGPSVWRDAWVQRLEGGATVAEYRLVDVPQGVYRLLARQGGRASPPTEIHVGGRSANAHDLLLPLAGNIAVRVVDAESRPIEGAKIEALRPHDDADGTAAGAMRSYTDSNGDATLSGLAAGEWRIVASTLGLAPRERSVRLEPNERLLLDDFLLEPGGTIEGTVHNVDDVPLIGLALTLRSLPDGVPAGTARTDDEGRYTFPHLAAQRYRLVLESVGVFEGRGREVDVLVEPGDSVVVDFHATGRASILGRLVRGGRGVSGARVSLWHGPTADAPRTAAEQDEEAERGRRVEHAISGGDGRFAFVAVEAGVALLEVEADSSLTLRRLSVEDHDRLELDIELQDGQLAGRVSDGDNLPVAAAWVEAFRRGSGGRLRPIATAETDAAGRFRMVGLAEARYDLRVFAVGRPPGRAFNVEARPDSAMDAVEIKLGRGGRLDIEVVDSGGVGISGVLVDLVAADGFSILRRPARTASFGRVSIDGVPEGTVAISAYRRGWGTPRPQVQQIVEGLALAVRIVLEPASTLSIVVVGDGPDVRTRARLALRRLPERIPIATRVRLGRRPPTALDPRPVGGVVTFEDLEGGMYEVEVDAGLLYEPFVGAFTVPARGPAAFEIRLPLVDR